MRSSKKDLRHDIWGQIEKIGYAYLGGEREIDLTTVYGAMQEMKTINKDDQFKGILEIQGVTERNKDEKGHNGKTETLLFS